MKKILIVSCLFDPEPVVSARLAKDLAEKFVELGHRPTVLCPQPSRPLSTDYSSTSIPTDYAYEVVRVDSFRSPEYSIFKRFYESYSFGKACAHWLEKNPYFDAVYVNTWPVFGQHYIIKQAKALNIPRLLHIQDLYPESLVERLPGIVRPFFAPFFSFEQKIASSASRIISISTNMMEYYQRTRKLETGQLSLVNNWQDESTYLDTTPNKAYATIADSGRFVFMFLGNIGPVAGVELLINAFHAAQLDNALLVIAGDGTMRSNCENLARQSGNSNILFTSVPFKDTGYVLSLSDACLLPIKKGHGISSIPSKLIGYLFAKRPILVSADLDCDSARVVRENDAGWTIEPEDTQLMASKMRAIVEERKEAMGEMGRNGSNYAKKYFSKEGGSTQLAETILEVANEKNSELTESYH